MVALPHQIIATRPARPKMAANKPQSLPLIIEAAELGADAPPLLVELAVDEVLEDDALVELVLEVVVLLLASVELAEEAVVVTVPLPEAETVGREADLEMVPDAEEPEVGTPDEAAPPPVTAKRGL